MKFETHYIVTSQRRDWESLDLGYVWRDEEISYTTLKTAKSYVRQLKNTSTYRKVRLFKTARIEIKP